MNGRSPWAVAWMLLVPLAVCLLAAKAIKVGITTDHYYSMGPASSRSLRLLGLLALSWVAGRMVFRRWRYATAVLFVAAFVASLFVLSVTKPDRTPITVLQDWTHYLLLEPVLFFKLVWRELVTLSLVALAMGAALRWLPLAARSAAFVLFKILVVALCVVVGVDLVFDITVGQPANIAVLKFSLANSRDLAPIVASEASPFKIGLLVISLLLPALWVWLLRQPRSWDAPGMRRPGAGLAVALLGSLAVFVPTLAIGSLPLERHAEGALLALSRTTASGPFDAAVAAAERSFDEEGGPAWHSAGMKLVAKQPGTKPKNVVVVMMESIRSNATTMYNPSLPTSPFLDKLSRESLLIDDMSVVVPRTAGAWMAILGGQYPLTNEGTARWSRENKKAPRVRGLPAGLRDNGYATSFFTPTGLGLLNEVEVVKALGFEEVFGEDEFGELIVARANYLGGADEIMVKPIAQWTQKQKEAGKPFFTAIMTNVGHHPYIPPAAWKMVQFPGVTDPALNAYYNCMLYIDGVLAQLMEEYKKLGVLDDTVFVIVGDHGQFFGEHGVRLSFNALYAEGIQVPALIYTPGMPSNRGRVSGARQQVDILPTIADLLGLEVQGAKLPGRSLLQPVDADRKLFYSTSMESSHLAMRIGPKKYIYSYGQDAVEAFNVADDPKEARPLPPLQPDAFKEVRRELLEWKAKTEMAMFARPENAPGQATTAWSRR
ncbi:MAG: LTA synthase family protein [Comamonadaceae bacterium]|nr:MAG: LTA synthase family protein [Comamonadaceae bacterium]